jgi:formate dehydrogenase major subunit
MTNHWIDMQHAKTVLVEGSNVAENHPMAFKWIRKAQENGAKIIHVDPRFTRTSAGADIYARIRPGTDAAFLNTMINHILTKKLYDEDFVKIHTNALYLGSADFEFKDGLFSGYDEQKHAYDTKTWGYQLGPTGKPRIATSLDDPHCIFARLETFESRYTLEMGERITGIPAAQIQEIAETMAKNRPGTILYALGMTQHTTGVQGIRGFTILQLLLGNLGKPGSGVNALRGEPNVQGACDMGVLNNYLPGYLDYPAHTEPTLEAYTQKNGTGDRRFMINMLKAFYGDAATPENDFAYAWLPKRSASKNYDTFGIFDSALAGSLKMLWIVGQNPAVTTPNLNLTFEAMGKLETLVVQEIWETETAAFWNRPGVDPKSISTEVVLLPAAFFMEKNGTITNSGGLVQWRNAAVKPPGQAKPDGEIVDFIFRRVRDLMHDTRDPKDEIVRKAFWTYLSAEDVLREMNGYALRDNSTSGLKAGDLVTKVADLQPDGSTSSGAWIYAGVFAGGTNFSKRRDSQTDPGGLGLYPNFAWTWPNNMRVLYNRASCDRHGKPYPGSKPIIWWDEKAKRWTGFDVPDVPNVTQGPDTPNGQRAFHMNPEGVGRLFAAVYKDPDPSADTDTADRDSPVPRDVGYVPKDGPLPEMYEPVESPVDNVLHPKVKHNPALKYPRVKSHQPIGTVEKFPYVLMTSTVAEHWCGGSSTRNIPWLNELVPEPVLEMPGSLAKKLSVKTGDWVKVSSARGEVQVKALVTPRMQPLQVDGREVTVVWMPYNWGFKGLSKGSSVNHVTIDAGDPGAGTQETKACLVNVVKMDQKAAKMAGGELRS